MWKYESKSDVTMNEGLYATLWAGLNKSRKIKKCHYIWSQNNFVSMLFRIFISNKFKTYLKTQTVQFE